MRENYKKLKKIKKYLAHKTLIKTKNKTFKHFNNLLFFS